MHFSSATTVLLLKNVTSIETASKNQQQVPIKDEKFKSLEIEVNDFKTAKTDLKVSFKEKSTEPPKPFPPIIKTTNTAKEFDGTRIPGLQENDAESARERKERDMSDVKAMLNFLENDCKITELRRIGIQQLNRDRTLVFKVSNKWHRNLILLSVAKLKNYSQQLFVRRELNATEVKLEMELFKKRKQMIEDGQFGCKLEYLT